MAKREQIWNSLEDVEYRHELVSENIKTGLAFQIRALRENRHWTQEMLAERLNKTQEWISKLEDPDYGSYTIRTLTQLAQAFDIALIVRFVAFSELVNLITELTPELIGPPSFEEEQSRANVISPAGVSGLYSSLRTVKAGATGTSSIELPVASSAGAVTSEDNLQQFQEQEKRRQELERKQRQAFIGVAQYELASNPA